MMRRWLSILLVLLLLTSCAHKEQYLLNEQEITTLEVAQDAYFLAGKKLQTISKSAYEEAETVYYAADEKELAQIIQYELENGRDELAYQSEQALDIDKVSKYLSVVNPFDLSLTQDIITYTNAQKDILYESYRLKITNLDPRYDASMKAAKQVVANEIKPDMDALEKISALHDYIITHSIYDVASQNETNTSGSVFQAAGVFVDGKAVCTGYSRAFMMLAKEAGIPCVYVSSKAMNHSWNYVYDGKSWRFIDVTWDDPVPDQVDMVDDLYLNMDESQFLKEGAHVLNDEELEMAHTSATLFFGSY